jgi:hypothetical protein
VGANLIRGIIIVLGTLMAVGGLVAVSIGGQMAVAGVWALVVGLVVVAATLLERSRYRSTQAELSLEAPGPGGGEPTDRPMEPRFRRTDERFIDPTTHIPMVVWLDPETGERRYRAEA